MTSFKRTLVAMDLSPMDSTLIKWVGELNERLGIQKMYFLHLMPDFRAPKNVDIEFHTLFSSDYPADEKVRDRLAEDVAKLLGDRAGKELAIEVHEGNPYPQVLHLSTAKAIDLLVIGRKQRSEGSGISARRITRGATTHVLIVPEASPVRLKHILVPVDFSERSATALRAAIDIAAKDHLSITALYVMDLPPSNYVDRPYANTGLQQLLHKAARETFDQFLVQFGDQAPFTVEEVILDNVSQNTGKHIVNFAHETATDLIVMGAQGHSAWENLWFGSVAEKVADTANCPVLIVR